ncbi:MAG: hypothetical protein KF914_08430 [Rhizobiaceae bacterium]|nr:hypothetical protein [Rhizobiaceae bacterium]
MLAAQVRDPVAIGEGDRLKLKIVGQPELSDVYEIAPGGVLVIPGLGTVSGLHDLDQARAEVRGLIERRLGLADVSVALTIDSYRPVVVGGNVSKPGDVPYKVGMRVAHALALAGGQGRRSNEDLSIELQINQEKERLVGAKGRLARALVKETRLRAEMGATPFGEPPAEIGELIGPGDASALVDTEKRTLAARIENRALSMRRVDASSRINSEDITAQQAVSKSLRVQLELVRIDLDRLEPMFAKGAITANRISELRRDYADIEGRVGQSAASLAQARTRQVVLAEEGTALDLQLRLELLAEFAGVQFEILDARTAIEAISRSLEAAGASPLETAGSSEPCRYTILREDAAATPQVFGADLLTPLKPGDLLMVGRTRSGCPDLAGTEAAAR